MKSNLSSKQLSPQEIRSFVLPAIIAILLVMVSITLSGFLTPSNGTSIDVLLAAFGVGASLYTILYYQFVLKSPVRLNNVRWINAVVSGVALGWLANTLSDQQVSFFYGTLILIAIVNSVTSGRWPTFMLILISEGVHLATHFQQLSLPFIWIQHLSLPLIAIIAAEITARLYDVKQQHINSLETINNFAQGISSTLDADQVNSLLNAAIQNALEADTYFVGLVEKDQIELNLFYDDGEYYSDVKVPIKGTLGGWVVRNQEPLYLPDLRQDIELDGVGHFIIGKDRTSLSWMGVPIHTEHVTGVIAVASYSPNAFNRTDLELLENLAQHATLSLDNAYHHALVEEQSHIDSLTGVFNHAYFLELVQEQAEQAIIEKSPLSLIMMDIDYFKQYNDAYGHLVGDKILTLLCKTIRRFIKNTDAIGRWGGEEFVISLPNANGPQATKVAERIRESMNKLSISNRDHKSIPVPTVSQGLAVLPDEADEIFRLIDLADQRLYVAKERGRNQIEPDITHWQPPKSKK
jgi:diguanylate cyclase (GGDEF)-like protein